MNNEGPQDPAELRGVGFGSRGPPIAHFIPAPSAVGAHGSPPPGSQRIHRRGRVDDKAIGG
eukprot:3068503-Pyramimonas_sp.AAC.1